MPKKKTGWRAAFLRALGASGNVRVAAGQAGVDPGTAYDWRAKDPAFAQKWEAARGKYKNRPSPRPSPARGRGSALVLRRTRNGDQMVRAAAGRWSAEVEEDFLDALRETACIESAATAVGISTAALYKRRENYPEFAERWEAVDKAARARIPDLLVAATLATFEGGEGKPRRRKRLPKVNVDQAIRISKMEAAKEAAGALRGRGRRPKIASNAEVKESLVKALAAFGKRVGQEAREEKLANGWTQLADGTMIPPGWVYVGVDSAG